MPKRIFCIKKTAGFTLIELMVGLGLASLIFLALMYVLGIGASLSAVFHNNAEIAENIADSVTQLTAIMSEVTRVNECHCSGSAAPSTEATCTYQEASATNFWDATDKTKWWDPVMNPSYNTTSSNPLVIFDGEYESFNGGDISDTDFQKTRFDQLPVSLQATCINYSTLGQAAFATTQLRGCKRNVRLTYTAPVKEVGATQSTAGLLKISTGSGTMTDLYIGDHLNTKNPKISVSELACGLVPLASDQYSMNFILNLKVKSRRRISGRVADSFYESWHPDGKNYKNGYFKEARLKFSFNNLNTRGVYQWRMQSSSQAKYDAGGGNIVHSCVPIGKPASSRAECCSFARSGGNCTECVASGVAAASAEQCCSGTVSGGVCQ